jgi:hypothetical protein
MVAFIDCVKYVCRRRLFDHIFYVSVSILGCSLLTYMVFRLACAMFSMLTEGIPLYLFGSLVYFRSERTLRINFTEHMVCFVLARNEGLEFSSCFCKVFFVTSGFKAYGVLIFRDHLLTLMLDFYYINFIIIIVVSFHWVYSELSSSFSSLLIFHLPLYFSFSLRLFLFIYLFLQILNTMLTFFFSVFKHLPIFLFQILILLPFDFLTLPFLFFIISIF